MKLAARFIHKMLLKKQRRSEQIKCVKKLSLSQ